MFHSKNIIIWGNQKCRGAIPDFRAKAIKIIKEEVKLKKVENFKFSRTAKIIKIIEANAWGMKYLIADSVELKFNLKRIRGIILIKLISNPSHLIIHELDEMVRKVPIIKNIKNSKWKFFLNIKKEEIKTLI